MTSILWEKTAKLFDATSIAGSLNAHLDSFCDGHLSFRMSSIFGVAKLWVYAMPCQYSEYRQPNWVQMTVFSSQDGWIAWPDGWPVHIQERYQPPQNPPKKQQCKNQECLATYKKKLIACARVRCKRRVDSVAASPREYLVRRAAKNVISPPPKTPPNPPPRNNNAKIKSVLQVTRRSW